MPIRAISAGKSSWPTPSAWRTMSVASVPDDVAFRAAGRRCCRALPCAAAAAGEWGCITRVWQATFRSIAAGPIGA